MSFKRIITAAQRAEPQFSPVHGKLADNRDVLKDKFKPCGIEWCGGNAGHHARGRRGYCVTHYNRLRAYGDPLGGGTYRGDPMRFVLAAIDYKGDDCLTWPYSTNRGYGIVWDGKRTMLAHRLVCIKVHGEPPTSKHEAAHSCARGHLGCVAPNHLRWATREENMADMIAHGNSYRRKTEAR